MYTLNLDAANTELPATVELVLKDDTRVKIRSYVARGGVEFNILSDSGNDWNNLGYLPLSVSEPIRWLRYLDKHPSGAVAVHDGRTSAMYRAVGNFWLSLGILVKEQP